MATGNPANKNAVLGRSITFSLTGQGANIAQFNRDLDTQVDSFHAQHVLKTMTREPSGASTEHEQYVSDHWIVIMNAEQIKSLFTDISSYQVGQARRGEAVDLLHLTAKTVFDDGSSRVRRYIDGLVQDANEKSGKMSAAATSDIKVKFSDRRG